MEEEKPFNAVWVVLLLIIAGLNDLGTLFFTGLAMTGVGLTGEGIMVPINAMVGGFFIIIFCVRMKSFAGPAIIQTAGSLAEFIIPSRLITVGIGMVLANNPKARELAELSEGDVEDLEKDAVEEDALKETADGLKSKGSEETEQTETQKGQRQGKQGKEGAPDEEREQSEEEGAEEGPEEGAGGEETKDVSEAESERDPTVVAGEKMNTPDFDKENQEKALAA